MEKKIIEINLEEMSHDILVDLVIRLNEQRSRDRSEWEHFQDTNGVLRTNLELAKSEICSLKAELDNLKRHRHDEGTSNTFKSSTHNKFVEEVQNLINVAARNYHSLVSLVSALKGLAGVKDMNLNRTYRAKCIKALREVTGGVFNLKTCVDIIDGIVDMANTDNFATAHDFTNKYLAEHKEMLDRLNKGCGCGSYCEDCDGLNH